MRAFEFQTQPNSDGSIHLPPDVAGQIAQASEVKVIVLLPDDEERQWVRFASQRFAEGYSPADNLYDDLRDG
jgi:hypothetical protein